MISAAELWLPLAADTYINGRQPGVNFGRSDDLVVHSYGPKEALLRFDASSIAGQTVAAAELRIDLTSLKSPGRLDLFAVTSSWDEDSATWDSSPPTEAIPFASGELETSDVGERFVIDVTELVIRWADGTLPDAGLAIRTSANIKAILGARDSGAGATLIASC